jgi:hypothetical protein
VRKTGDRAGDARGFVARGDHRHAIGRRVCGTERRDRRKRPKVPPSPNQGRCDDEGKCQRDAGGGIEANQAQHFRR